MEEKNFSLIDTLAKTAAPLGEMLTADTLLEGLTSAFAEKLGKDYSVVIPETMPFLAELMEDDNDIVVKHCHVILQRLGEITVEPLQNYL